jgi:hypothetical protein
VTGELEDTVDDEMMHERAARADPEKAMQLLREFGSEAPQAGDEMPEVKPGTSRACLVRRLLHFSSRLLDSGCGVREHLLASYRVTHGRDVAAAFTETGSRRGRLSCNLPTKWQTADAVALV